MPRVVEIALTMLVAMAAWSDLRSRTIPNWITIPGAGLGLILRAWYGGLPGAWSGLEGAVLGLGIFVVLFVAGGAGAGDVKLFGAVGAFLGPEPLILVFVLTGILGGIAAGAAAIWRGRLPATLPYGAVIAGGTLMSLIVVG
jgi:prepilin peptidase CpaA